MGQCEVRNVNRIHGGRRAGSATQKKPKLGLPLPWLERSHEAAHLGEVCLCRPELGESTALFDSID